MMVLQDIVNNINNDVRSTGLKKNNEIKFNINWKKASELFLISVKMMVKKLGNIMCS